MKIISHITLVYQDIGGVDRWIWFVLGNLLALASICPFVGSMSDLFGRRYVAIFGASLLIIGMIVCSTAHNMNIFIAGMAISGVGAGINELTALAATSEIAPTRKRGFYVSMMVLTILPFCPSQLWGQLVASHGGWRYIGLWCGLWAFVGLVLTIIFYHPPPRANSTGLSRRDILRRIDYVGGLLSISGMLLFMMGLQWVRPSFLLVEILILCCCSKLIIRLGRIQLPLGFGTYSGPTPSWCFACGLLLRLGIVLRQIPNVSAAIAPRASYPRTHARHNPDQWSKLLLNLTFLANTILQRIWS